MSTPQQKFRSILMVAVFELLMLFVLAASIAQVDTDQQRILRAKAIIQQTNSLTRLCNDSGVAMGGYSITKSDLFSKRFDHIVAEIHVEIENLKSEIGDDKRQQESLVRLRALANEETKILTDCRSIITDSRASDAQFKASHVYQNIRNCADQMHTEMANLIKDEVAYDQSTAPKDRTLKMVSLAIWSMLVILNLILILKLLPLVGRRS